MITAMRTRRLALVALFVAGGYVAVAGCGDDDDGGAGHDAGAETGLSDVALSDGALPRSPEYTGSACAVATDCYEDLEAGSLKGEPFCIDKVTGGYCTHKCQTDADCCAVPGECKTTLKQVCASFENEDEKYCFLSCEDEDIARGTDAGLSEAGTVDGDDYCHANANREFGCRSSGGGSENRKVCFPNVGDGGLQKPKDGGLDADAALDADADAL